MLSRCYDNRIHEKHPTYKICTVCDEWLDFGTFKAWMKSQDWKGKELDKDILVPGNKIYGPDACFFVTTEVNNLLKDRGASRGMHPLGVSFNKQAGRFVSNCRSNGKSVFLGYFDDENMASKAYKEFKYKVINEVAERQDPVIREALKVHANLLMFKPTKGGK